MTGRLSTARAIFVVLALFLFGITAAACGSDGKPASQSNYPVPSPGSASELTAQEIIDLASKALGSVVSTHGEGSFVSYELDGIEEPEFATMVFDWTAPDRSTQVVMQDQGDGIVESRTIIIGNRGFTLSPYFNDGQWREVRITQSFDEDPLSTPEPSETPENPFNSLADIVPDGPVEVVEFNGVIVYKLAATQVPRDLMAYEDPRENLETRVVLFIDAATFLVLRDERVLRSTNVIQEYSPNESEQPKERTEYGVIEYSLDFTYSDEPLVIEIPANYIPFNDGSNDGPISTPTAVVAPLTVTVPVPSATATIVPGAGGPPVGLATATPAPFPTFAPDDPNRNIPFFIFDTPYYDKLELGNNVIVSYPQCNARNSVIDRIFNIAIFYMIDGSMAANGAWYSPQFDSENPDAFTVTAFHSEEGRIAVQTVLNDPETMARIIEYSDVNVRCPAEFLGYTGDTFETLPDTDWYRIDDQTIARFESCGTAGVSLAAPVLVAHTPSRTVAAITSKDDFPLTTWHEEGTNAEYLWQLLRDKALLERLLSLAPREVRCG